jgi:hypothetical protein
MRQTFSESERVELIGHYSAGLSLIEVALGSLLHSFHVPLTGDFLSLNQGFLLCRASIRAKASGVGRVGYAISNVAAVLKSLSPAGKKLGPMVSLSAQGFLFTLGEFVFGANLAGWIIGMILLSLWTVVQQLATYYLMFGPTLVKAASYFVEKALHVTGFGWSQIFWIFGALVAGKALIAASLAVIAWWSRGESALQDRLLRMAEQRGASAPPPRTGSPLWLAVRDLFRPLFLGSLAVTAFFLYFSESDRATWIWVLLRPVAIGFFFFYLSRTFALDRWLRKLHGTRGEEFSRACSRALGKLRQKSGAEKIPSAP